MLRIATAAVSLLIVAAPTLAKDRDPRIEAVLECATITDPDARLQCYDSKMAGFRQAVDAGRVIAATESTRPFALEGVIKGSAVSGFNRFIVILDTGDRWELVADSSFDSLPRTGAKVRIKKGAMGAYWFVEPNVAERRAKYLGRRI